MQQTFRLIHNVHCGVAGKGISRNSCNTHLFPAKLCFLSSQHHESHKLHRLNDTISNQLSNIRVSSAQHFRAQPARCSSINGSISGTWDAIAVFIRRSNGRNFSESFRITAATRNRVAHQHSEQRFYPVLVHYEHNTRWILLHANTSKSPFSICIIFKVKPVTWIYVW